MMLINDRIGLNYSTKWKLNYSELKIFAICSAMYAPLVLLFKWIIRIKARRRYGVTREICFNCELLHQPTEEQTNK